MPVSDGSYADVWIRHHESNDDEFRGRHLEPHLRNTLAGVKGPQTVLDVGCGWGIVPGYLAPGVRYFGVDTVEEFFDYIRKKHPGRELTLRRGGLPDEIGFEGILFDVVVASMVLHVVRDLAGSMGALFEKALPGGAVHIVTFADAARPYLESCFETVRESTGDSISGAFVLPSGLKTDIAMYFHGEHSYEAEAAKHGSVRKRSVGPIFVAYECTKNPVERKGAAHQT